MNPPEPWGHRPHWRILDTCFGTGQRFLEAWQAWRADPARPALLQVAGILPWPESAQALARLPLREELAAQWWGLTPGVHRMVFEQGRVTLTLHVGLPTDALREMRFAADAVWLGPPGPAACRDAPQLKAIAHLCRRGGLLHAIQPDTALREGLRACGFVTEQGGEQHLLARYDPAWTPRHLRAVQAVSASHAVVIGAGLAGASAAAALALRGWQVEVLDQATQPAAGASALPAGLMAPHLSPDDNLLSRLSRAGLRITLQHARALLRPGQDWQGGGTLEHRVRPKARPLQAEGFAADWSREATPTEKQRALLPQDALAVWHGPAAWIRPGALVRAWLDQPGIRWRGGLRAAALRRDDAGWTVLGEAGAPIAQAPMVVIAAALGSAALSEGRLWLHPVRGQVSWGLHEPGLAMPEVPVNGNGHLLPHVSLPEGRGWMIGSSYGRGESDTDERAQDHAANLQRLRSLHPLMAQQLEPRFIGQRVRAWTGVRCASTDRRPLVGELEPGLWVSTAMGSRGLTFAALCAELLAAQLHGEPLPVGLSLVGGLEVGRLR